MVSLHHFPSPTMVMIGYFCCILVSLVVKTFTSPEAAEDMQGAVLFRCPCRVKLDWLVKIACRHFKYVYRKYIATDLLKPAVKWKCLLERGKVHVPSPSNVKIQTGFNKLLLLLHAMLFFFFHRTCYWQARSRFLYVLVFRGTVGKLPSCHKVSAQ